MLGSIVTILGWTFLVVGNVALIQKNWRDRQCHQPLVWILLGLGFHFTNSIYGFTVAKPPVWAVSLVGTAAMAIVLAQWIVNRPRTKQAS